MTDVVEELVDHEALARYLSEIDLLGAGETLAVALLSGGRSNLTFAVDAGDRRLILRRRPLGQVPRGANDMAREHRVQSALAGSGVPVATMHGFSEDESIVGAPFYVMDRVEGEVWDRPADVASVTPAEADAASRSIVEALVAVHRVDPDAVGLGQLGRPEGFLERRISRWSELWPEDSVLDRTLFDSLGRRLLASLPAEAAPGLVHGDYRLGNVMFSPGPDRRAAAVLDWELSTLGDRLTDLAHLVLYWAPTRGRITHEAQRVGGVGGFWTAAQLVAAYEAGGTLAVDDLDWYLAFDSWRAAVIKAGIHARSLRGETRGEGDDVGGYVPLHLEDADELLAERGQ